MQQTPNLYTVDLDSAIAMCSWEIIEMLTKCFGAHPRVNNYLETCRKSINYISKYCDEKDMYKNGLIMSIINQFGDMGGFDALLNLITTKDDYKCPIPIMSAVARHMTLLHKYMNKDFNLKFSTQLADLISARMDPKVFSDNEIKEVRIDELHMVGKSLAIFRS